MSSVDSDSASGRRPSAWELGRLLRLEERPAEAVNLLQPLASKSRDYRLHDELGASLVALNRPEEAIGSFMTALRLQPDFDEACGKIGSAFASRGLFEPAAYWFCRGRQMNPTSTKFLFPYGRVLVSLGNTSQAAAIFHELLEAEPENAIARHLATAALGTQTLTKATAEYVRALFEEFAGYFDETLARLKYCGPELIDRALRQVAGSPAGNWNILDAGCGTGLSGIVLKPYARRLVGVDLSPSMLRIARQRSIYDDLMQADVIDHLRGQKQEFDLIVASDVLTYFGELNEFFAAAAVALRPSGMVAVAVEALTTGNNYRLNPTGRFSHSDQYLQEVMESAGFAIALIFEDAMRFEADKPVATWVAVGASTIAR
jgi:predicted TPR repeat methyltransferase